MTIGGWIGFIVIVLFVGGLGGWIAYLFFDSEYTIWGIVTIIIALAIIVGSFLGLRWYFNNTASGQRALVDQKSDFNNGVERVVNVYTANGDLIAQYSGHIDIDTNDGGYVKFDFEGKRYIYYNCFVETIAEIG